MVFQLKYEPIDDHLQLGSSFWGPAYMTMFHQKMQNSEKICVYICMPGL